MIKIILFKLLLSITFFSIGCIKTSPQEAVDDFKSKPEIPDTSPTYVIDIPFDENLVFPIYAELYASDLEMKVDIIDEINENILRSININNINTSQLDTKERGWFNMPPKNGVPPEQPKEVRDLLDRYSSRYLGDTNQKHIYLTFNNGYENGYTPRILDILKTHDVPAAFFVLKPYILSNSELILRMEKEGHLVVNHSANHHSMPAVRDTDKFNAELSDLEKAYEEVTGKKMARFFRPPSGTYSEHTLYHAAALGYKTVFWSFAYDDWDTQRQHSHEYAKKLITERAHHNGAIVMLHSVSKTNTEILEEMINLWKAKGFEFKSLFDLPH